jgi:hypothetical protein
VVRPNHIRAAVRVEHAPSLFQGAEFAAFEHEDSGHRIIRATTPIILPPQVRLTNR